QSASPRPRLRVPLRVLRVQVEATSTPAPAPATALASNSLQEPSFLVLKRSSAGKACIAQARGRGAGVPVSSCHNGSERNGMLCYKQCSANHTGVGPVCWRSCPSDTRDMGGVCWSSYGKGCCCTVFGCCGGCKPGYKDAGCFCRRSFTKHSYGRGAGTPLVCKPDEEENGGLCYKACPQGFAGQGPVCWEEASSVSRAFPHKCNAVLYTVDSATCAAIAAELAKTGSFTAVCVALGLAVAFAAPGASLLMPAASFFCGKSFDAIVEQAQHILEITQAKACAAA
ncbi:uncharacterized protein LOC112345149, partial [Selaginella moellendorffii]|uniref:uncharacterized protein LOC112345149 n=1 Tax=Selaginella moellendorffii TaxID=88036 RepID=UPI000D1C40F8